jgi:hypothetical protein
MSLRYFETFTIPGNLNLQPYRSVTGIRQLKPGFDLRLRHMGFVVDGVAFFE